MALVLMEAVSRHMKDKKVTGNSPAWIYHGQTVPDQCEEVMETRCCEQRERRGPCLL